jgi:hypothetical protein
VGLAQAVRPPNCHNSSDSAKIDAFRIEIFQNFLMHALGEKFSTPSADM